MSILHDKGAILLSYHENFRWLPATHMEASAWYETLVRETACGLVRHYQSKSDVVQKAKPGSY